MRGARRIDHSEHASIDAAQHLKSGLAVVETLVDLDHAVRVKENADGIGEIETPFFKQASLLADFVKDSIED